MKRILFATFFVTLALASSPVLAELPLVISPGTHNFGKIPQHAVANKRFWIKSTAPKPIKISHVIPDCGCTNVMLLDSTIAPGDSVALDLIFHSRAFVGYMTKRPAVKIEGSNENAVIQFYAEVLVKPETARPLVMEPVKVDVSQFGEKVRRKGTFKLTNFTAFDLNIQVVDSSFKSFEINIPTVIKAGKSIEGQVIVRKEYIETEFEEAFTIELNDDGRTRYAIPVFRLYHPNAMLGQAGK
ncbi:MAG: DUF1573 domain-containing protein [bacterium]|nr:DUF1573 domain-containing protein [bacterium]